MIICEDVHIEMNRDDLIPCFSERPDQGTSLSKLCNLLSFVCQHTSSFIAEVDLGHSVYPRSKEDEHVMRCAFLCCQWLGQLAGVF